MNLRVTESTALCNRLFAILIHCMNQGQAYRNRGNSAMTYHYEDMATKVSRVHIKSSKRETRRVNSDLRSRGLIK